VGHGLRTPELQHVFNEFLKYQMEILLGDFNAKVGRGYIFNIFKLTIGNESLHETINDSGIGVVKKKSTMFPHFKIHKYIWTSPDRKTQSN
jgi:hypothetical protein